MAARSGAPFPHPQGCENLLYRESEQMINVAIVEDEVSEADLLASYLERFSETSEEKFNLFRFTDPVVFLTKYTGKFDIIFLDINMPYMNGMEAAKKLRAIDADVAIVFVTNMAKYAVNGYEVNAFDFLVKPVVYTNFVLKMRRILDYLNGRKDKKISVTTREGVACLSVAQLMYAEVMNHKLIYHLQGGREVVAYGQLKKVEEMLRPFGFARCNSCYLVNLRHVKSVRDFTVVVGEDSLSVSHAKKRDFLQALADYLGGV